jgi:SPX domain protein involved in polyphosphate accumulation
MARDRMQKQRFELKYLINEDTALRVRDFVRSYLDFDEYSVGKPNYSYPVHSLYLDSDTLYTYWTTINGDKNRFKMRVRYYSDNPGAPAFFEIKRRVNNCIMKQRASVKKEMVPMLLSGMMPERDHLNAKNDSHLFALQRFLQLMGEIQAKPKVHVFYLREAYLNDDDTVRVTMDRSVYGEPMLEPLIRVKPDPAHTVPNFTKIKVKSGPFDAMDDTSRIPKWVILELKYTNRFPTWFGELVRIFNVMQSGAAKYLESIENIGFKKLKAVYPVVGDPVGMGRPD